MSLGLRPTHLDSESGLKVLISLDEVLGILRTPEPVMTIPSVGAVVGVLITQRQPLGVEGLTSSCR